LGPIAFTESGRHLNTNDCSGSDRGHAAVANPDGRRGVRVFGILNVTPDSFSDGGRFFEPAAALSHADYLIAGGADVIDVGAASSHPDSEAVSHDEQMRRLLPVLSALRDREVAISVDTQNPRTQEACLEIGVDYLNDVDGFCEPRIYPKLATASCKLVVMHSVLRAPTDPLPTEISMVDAICEFFERRVGELINAGVSRERLVLDPGMGLFVGPTPESSLRVLRELPTFKKRFDLPLMVSVSRKSFLGAVTGRQVAERGAATLAAELCAVDRGVDYVRTHDVSALCDALAFRRAFDAGSDPDAADGVTGAVDLD
jgi:dihydropteroate synthase type 2